MSVCVCICVCVCSDVRWHGAGSLPNASIWQGGCVGPESIDDKNELTTRAAANLYHAAGCDGIYAFNWHSDGSDFRRRMLEVVGDANTLQRVDKIYAAAHRVVVREGFFNGAYRVDRLCAEMPVALHRTLTAGGGSRRRDCHSTGISSLSILKHLLKGEAGAAE